MDYLSYEETIPILQDSYFGDYKFYQKTDVHQLIDILPDEPYAELPQSADPDSSQPRGPQGSKISPSQLGKLKPAAKALLMCDERKACGIAKFVKDTLYRDLQGVEIEDTQNCCFQAVLNQISNQEYMFNQETGEHYNHTYFRNQVIHNMVINCNLIYPKLIELNLLPTSYKMWLHQQLSDDVPADEVTIIGIRYLLNVSTNIFKYQRFSFNLQRFLGKGRKYRKIVEDAVRNCQRF